MNKTTEVRLTGFGGQGIILAGYITGKAASLYADLHATLTQNYGPESRGGASSIQLIISTQPIFYPVLTRTDILVAMSQEGYIKYAPELKPDGILLIEENLVTTKPVSSRTKTLGIPATRLAESIGKKVVTNMVMLGFMIGQTKLLPQDTMTKAIKTSVPKGTEEINLKAFMTGYEYKNN